MAKEYLRYQNFLLAFAEKISEVNVDKPYKNFFKLKLPKAKTRNLTKTDDSKITLRTNAAILNAGSGLGDNAWHRINNLEGRNNLFVYLAKDVKIKEASGAEKNSIYKINFHRHPSNFTPDIATRVFLHEVNINKVGKNAEERLRNLQGHITIKFTKPSDLIDAIPCHNIANPDDAKKENISINELLYSSVNNPESNDSDLEAATPDNSKFHIFIEYDDPSPNPDDYIQYISKKSVKIRICSYQYEIKFNDTEQAETKIMGHELKITFVGYIEAAEKDIRNIFNNLFDIINVEKTNKRLNALEEIKKITKDFQEECETTAPKDRNQLFEEKYKNKLKENLKDSKIFDTEERTNIVKDLFKNIPIYRIKDIDKRIFNLQEINLSRRPADVIASIATGLFSALFIGLAMATGVGEVGLGVVSLFALFGIGSGGVSAYFGLKASEDGRNETKNPDRAVDSNDPSNASRRLSDARINNSNETVFSEFLKNIATNTETVDRTEDPVKTLESIEKDPKSLEALADSNGTISVRYFFLGDLLEKLLVEKNSKKYIEEHVFFDIPIFRLELDGTEKITRVNIADIPISYEGFLIFLKENLLDKKEDAVYVEVFINDILNYLESSVGANYYGNSKQVTANISISREILEYPVVNQNNDKLNIFLQKTQRDDTNRKTLIELEDSIQTPVFDSVKERFIISPKIISESIINSYKNGKAITTDFIFYKIYKPNVSNIQINNFYKEFSDSEKIHDFMGDKGVGSSDKIDKFTSFMQKNYSIPTFSMFDENNLEETTRKRLSKKFEFSKVNLKYLKETQMTQNAFKGLYREPYDFTLTTHILGSLYFETGINIFILPYPTLFTSRGERSSEGKENYFYNMFGLGGLYLVTQVDISFIFGVSSSDVAKDEKVHRVDLGQSLCKLTCKFQGYGDGSRLVTEANATPNDCKVIFRQKLSESSQVTEKVEQAK